MASSASGEPNQYSPPFQWIERRVRAAMPFVKNFDKVYRSEENVYVQFAAVHPGVRDHTFLDVSATRAFLRSLATARALMIFALQKIAPPCSLPETKRR